MIYMNWETFRLTSTLVSIGLEARSLWVLGITASICCSAYTLFEYSDVWSRDTSPQAAAIIEIPQAMALLSLGDYLFSGHLANGGVAWTRIILLFIPM